MIAQVVDTQSLAHCQLAELLRDIGVYTLVDERRETAIGRGYAERARHEPR